MKKSFIGVRLTDEQKEMLTKKAEASGMNISQYLRILILKDLDLIK